MREKWGTKWDIKFWTQRKMTKIKSPTKKQICLSKMIKGMKVILSENKIETSFSINNSVWKRIENEPKIHHDFVHMTANCVQETTKNTSGCSSKHSSHYFLLKFVLLESPKKNVLKK